MKHYSKYGTIMTLTNEINLNSLRMFVLVVKHAGFSEASRKENIPVATLSRRIAELEKQMDTRLLQRSTRLIKTTKEGDILFDAAARALDEIKIGELALSDLDKKLKGTLRLSIPRDVNFWWELLQAFQASYPNIKLDIFTTERRVDLIADGIDVALRIGELKSQTAIARKIADYRHLVVASPTYIEKHGVPLSPSQLNDFPIGSWGNNPEQVTWIFSDKPYEITPKVTINDYSHLLALTLADNIITELPPLLAQPYIDSGSLIHLLPDWKLPKLSLNLVYPTRKHLSPLSRTYIDFALNYCKQNQIFAALS